jgi:hypothetical protein
MWYFFCLTTSTTRKSENPKIYRSNFQSNSFNCKHLFVTPSPFVSSINTCITLQSHCFTYVLPYPILNNLFKSCFAKYLIPYLLSYILCNYVIVAPRNLCDTHIRYDYLCIYYLYIPVLFSIDKCYNSRCLYLIVLFPRKKGSEVA